MNNPLESYTFSLQEQILQKLGIPASLVRAGDPCEPIPLIDDRAPSPRESPMNEQEWLSCTDPARMLRYLETARPDYDWDAAGATAPMKPCPVLASDRKLRLFACACCREVWDRVTDDWARQTVILAERNADGLDEPDRMIQMRPLTYCVPGSQPPWVSMAAAECCNPYAVRAARQAIQLPTCPDTQKAALLRDIVGNPFRRHVVLPRDIDKVLRIGAKHFKQEQVLLEEILAWNDGTIPRIAQGIYDDRAWDHMPMLSDALLDAGCDNDDITQHCREKIHTRGCWTLDLILNLS